jgi:serine protease 56
MDSCAGDSGGPILCKEGDKWTIFGITSFGEGCGKKGKYGIYTRLSNYIKWIQKTIREEY